MNIHSKLFQATAAQLGSRSHPVSEAAPATSDRRWDRVVAVLTALRERGRHAVRIVDAECGAGCLLLAVLNQASELGFTAIEGRGIDASPWLIGRAQAAAKQVRISGCGVEFEAADMTLALTIEHDFPADIVIWHGAFRSAEEPAILRAVCAAGDVVIGDTEARHIRRMAA